MGTKAGCIYTACGHKDGPADARIVQPRLRWDVAMSRELLMGWLDNVRFIKHCEHDRLPPDEPVSIPKFTVLGFECVCGAHTGVTSFNHDIGDFDCAACGRVWTISCE